MARTPLLRSLQRLAADFEQARAHGLSLHAYREERAEARRRAQDDPEPFSGGLTRRELLAAAGAVLTTAALPRSMRAASSAPRIAIVGAGIAGLNCALELADKGIASTVYEASGRIGGRMFSNNSGYWEQNQVSEWGGELIDTGHTTIRRLARRFDLPMDNVRAAEPAGSEDTYHFFGGYYPVARATEDFAPVLERVVADEASAPFPTSFDDFTPEGRVLDRMSVYDWIESRVDGGHDSPFGRLLDVAYAIEYGANTRQQSALNLIYLLAFQPEPSGLELFGESDESFHIRGGNQQLPQAIAAHLGGTVVQRGMSLVRVQKTSDGRYRLSFEGNGSTKDVVADYVVLALPFAVLRGIDTRQAGFDALKQRAIQDLGRAHSGKLQLQFTRRFWNRTGPWPGISNGSTYADTGYQASWDVTRAQPGTRGIQVFYSGGSVTDAMKTDQPFAQGFKPGVMADATRALAQIEPVFPGLSALWNERVTQSLPHKSPFFNSSYSYYRVGQYTSFAGYEGVRQGGVFFCGEHTSQSFQGFMEGGASEGARVGHELARIVKRAAA